MAVIPFAGEVITNDIREGCSILLKWAEQLKIQYGQAMGDFAEDEKVVTIPGHNGWEPKEISFKSLAFIIQARLEEIIDSIYFQAEKSGFLQQSAQGIVLTGGTSKLLNLIQLTKFRTGMDARLGFSQVRLAGNPDLDKTSFLTALGMLKLSLRSAGPTQVKRGVKPAGLKENGGGRTGNGFFGNLGKKVSQQISLIFEDEQPNM
jgi:cell division protein FtsA